MKMKQEAKLLYTREEENRCVCDVCCMRVAHINQPLSIERNQLAPQFD